ncbi:hypothetical protein [Klebsiella pneumoniae]|uniref:hypothetical protein n=1 Tax=Klebsiella pneumoniae TaxID=573 RepID=UPI0022449EF1|nr:hypothetical protein [Klebsiella pneumoniae]
MKKLIPLLLVFPLVAFASTDLVDGPRYIVPISGPGIKITNPYTDYKVISSIDNGKKIEVNVSLLNLRTYKGNTGLSKNVYTEDYLKLSSESAQNSTKEDLKKLYCMPDGFYPVSSQERLFSETRKEHKKIMINYYSDSGETLMFGLGVSPESCNSK